MTQPKLWKVNCMEGTWPGMWQRWYKNQCVAIGWPDASLNDGSTDDPTWSAARNAIQEMQPGDYVVVSLQGHRVGRLGQVFSKAIEDDEWNPLVPIGHELPQGEMGRRILVRWDLTVGPPSPDMVVQLSEKTFTSGELRATVRQIRSMSLATLREEMINQANWVYLYSFPYERALSDYIANYPHRLEEGLLPHPNKKIRELAFPDSTRLDVLLIDQNDVAVVVECKLHSPTVENVDQLRGYMRNIKAETGEDPRGILVHGGASKLPASVIAAARKAPRIEIVSYNLLVDFKPSAEV